MGTLLFGTQKQIIEEWKQKILKKEIFTDYLYTLPLSTARCTIMKISTKMRLPLKHNIQSNLNHSHIISAKISKLHNN